MENHGQPFGKRTNEEKWFPKPNFQCVDSILDQVTHLAEAGRGYYCKAHPKEGGEAEKKSGEDHVMAKVVGLFLLKRPYRRKPFSLLK